MANVLEAKARPGTNTVKRPWPNNTETPEPHQDRGQDNPPSPDDLVQLESGSYVYTINWDRKVQFTVPASDDQDNAIQKTHGANLSSRLQRVLPFVALYTPLAASSLAEVIERLLRCDALIAPQRVRDSASTQPRRRYDRFRTKLIATLLDEAIEDGVTHPAESLIDEAFRADSSDCQNWLSQVLVEHYPTRPSLCASIVRCIGRLDYDRVRGWGMRVVDDALQNRDIEVREAAIRALEAWGRPAALDVLRRHKDAVAWLNEYVRQVVVDLSGTSS